MSEAAQDIIEAQSRLMERYEEALKAVFDNPHYLTRKWALYGLTGGNKPLIGEKIKVTREEPLPCPFYNGRAEVQESNPFDAEEEPAFMVFCQECGTEQPWRDTREDALEFWNRRSLVPSAAPRTVRLFGNDAELIKRLVIPMVLERSIERGDAWDQAHDLLIRLT